MSGIDETSHKLGNLDGKTDAILDQLKTLSIKMGDVYDKQTLMNGSVAKAHWRLDDLADELASTTKLANDLYESKKKVWYTILGLSAGGSFAGTKLATIINAVFN